MKDHESDTFRDGITLRVDELLSAPLRSAVRGRPLEEFLATWTGWSRAAVKVVSSGKQIANRLSEILNRPDVVQHAFVIATSDHVAQGVAARASRMILQSRLVSVVVVTADQHAVEVKHVVFARWQPPPPIFSAAYPDAHFLPVSPETSAIGAAINVGYGFGVNEPEGQPLNEGKLILLGRGEVGKTSLVRRLMGQGLRGDEAKTQGINISRWDVHSGSGPFRLNIWDFGGQEIMHATHQFFLTKKSLYVLVLNGREGGEDADAEYWLKQISSFGGNSPVIVVQNKIDQHPFELNYRGLRDRYPQIRGFVKTECVTGSGLPKLRDAITQAIDAISDVRVEFSPAWLAVRHAMESLGAPYLSAERFRMLCDAEGIHSEGECNELAGAFHNLGIALNFRDDSRLRETSVLAPEWVTKAIYKILNASELADRKGVLELSDLGDLLPPDQYPQHKHYFLIELMRKFSLCFAYPETTDRFLVPELLGKEEHPEVATFDPRQCLNFEYRYGVLPEGLLPRYIVRSHVLSDGLPRWRSGVIVSHDGCKALVMANAVDRRVTIRVKGNGKSRRQLLAVIRSDFVRMHAEFQDRLEAREMVPLHDAPDVSIEYKKLALCEMQGISAFPELVGERIVNVPVAALLDGVDLAPVKQIEAGAAEPVSLVFSYSHEDEPLRNQLATHLKILEHQKIITSWWDRKIVAGDEWDKEIASNFEEADIILLLVSADFIASDYCWAKEMKRAMERHEAGEAYVVPVSVRRCDWAGAPFAQLQGVPKDMVPVTAVADRDTAWADVTRRIRELAEKIRSERVKDET